ncbi:uncharacterized protein [Macaca nemestrina]|uniref:uncharacterized protein n=1 Tax=Macaca nemestrina TaxID=9545 RepID=UPI0039B84DF4
MNKTRVVTCVKESNREGGGTHQRPRKEHKEGPLAEDKGGAKKNAELVSPTVPARERGKEAVVQARYNSPSHPSLPTQGSREKIRRTSRPPSTARDATRGQRSAGTVGNPNPSPHTPAELPARPAQCTAASACGTGKSQAARWTSGKPPPTLTSQDQEVPSGRCREPRHFQPSPQLQVCACAGRSLGLHLPEASAPTASARALRPRRVGAAERLGAGEPVPVLERSGKERAACTTGMARPDALEDPGNCSPCSDEKNQDSETIKVTEMKLTEPGFRIFFLDSFVGLRTGHPVYSAHCTQPLAGVCRVSLLYELPDI